MGPLEELKLHAEALASAVEANPKFFASVKHYIGQLHQIVTTSSTAPTRADLLLLVSKLEEFWAKWRPTPGGGLYIPPRETADTDSTVRRMVELVQSVATTQDSEFGEMATRLMGKVVQLQVSESPTPDQRCVFIGHGRNRLWARVKLYLEDELGLATVTYESESRTGDSIIPVLEKMLAQATFAVLLLTAEDDASSGDKRARQNVIHEAGLFQGRLGFRRAVLLMQEGTESFSNVAGLQHIPFSGDNIEQTFYELQRVLKREGHLAG